MGRARGKRDKDTARARNKRACRRLLEDLRREHGAPPPDVRVGAARPGVALVVAPDVGSGCSSAASW